MTALSMRFVAALAAAGALFGGMVLVLSASGRHETSTTTLFSGTVGVLYLVAGSIAHWRQPDNRTGLLMVLVGFGWFAEDLQVAVDPLTHTIGLLLRSASTGLLLHLVLAFPTGELRSRIDRVVVMIGYVAVFGLVPLSTVAFPTVTENLLLIWEVYWVRDVISTVQAVVSAMVVIVLAVRWITASRPARRVLAPVVLTGLLGSVQSLLGPILNTSLISDIGHAAVLMLPLAFLAGVWRIRLGRTNVADLLVKLPRSAPTELQNLLAKALGDPSLRVAYYREDNGDYVDLEGQPLTIPPDQSVSVVVREGRQVAALLHDPALREDRHVLEAVKSAAALELDNQRLAAEVRAQLVEVRASRARIVAAGDEQRRRVERDLHDGAQQQLVTVALLLKLARQRLDDLPSQDDKLADYLTRSADGLTEALRELRELARGIHPAVLSEAGLGAALRALAARSPQPVEVCVAALPKLPPPVEATAYYVAAEALTNALKHAQAKTIRVTVLCADSSLSLEVVDDGHRRGVTGSRNRTAWLAGQSFRAGRSTDNSQRRQRNHSPGRLALGVRMTLRVVLADDARLFRAALAELLESNGCTIVGQVGDPDGLRAMVAEKRPDIAVVDIRMPPTHQLEGLHAATDIRREHPGVGVLLLSQYVEAAHLKDLVDGGTHGVGYLLKDRASGPDFLDAVRQIAAGGCVFDQEVVNAMLTKPRHRLDALSAREREVLSLMAQGLSNSAISTKMHVAAKTVETHVRRIFERLNLPDAADHHRRVLAVLAFLE